MVQVFNTTSVVLPITQKDVNDLLLLVANHSQVSFESVELVYVDADYIIDINQRFLQRSYATDVISFRLDDNDDQAIEGTIYCCVPQIQEQALTYQVSEQHEFARIAIHGFLHLAGFDDASSQEKEMMTHIEDQLLTQWFS